MPIDTKATFKKIISWRPNGSKRKQATDQAPPKASTSAPRSTLSSATQTDLLASADPFAHVPMSHQAMSTPNLLLGGPSPASTAVQTPPVELSPTESKARPRVISIKRLEPVQPSPHLTPMPPQIAADEDAHYNALALSRLAPPPAPRMESHERFVTVVNLPAPPRQDLQQRPAPSIGQPLHPALRRHLALSGTFGPQLDQPLIVASPSLQSMQSTSMSRSPSLSFEVHEAQFARPAMGHLAPHIINWPREYRAPSNHASDTASTYSNSSESSFGHDPRDFQTREYRAPSNHASDTASSYSDSSESSFGHDPRDFQ